MPQAQTHAHAAPRQDLRAPLTFIRKQATKPQFKSAALTGGEPEVTFELERHEVDIHDMRQVADRLTLDDTGFELRRMPTAVADLYDDATIAQTYEPEVIALLKAHTGADDVVVFDHTRRSDAATGASNPDGARGPASRVHVDYTVASGPQRARDVLGDAAVTRVLDAGGRIMQVNVWRPIRGPVRRAPLALAAAKSVPFDSLVATDQLFADRTGEIYHLAYDARQEWFYAPEMTPEEVILIKGWDSLDDGRARFTPHGAVVLDRPDESLPPRESIETRTYLVFAPD